MVVVDGLPAHTVGDSQPAVIFQKTSQNLDQPLGLGEVGESIVDHDAVEFLLEYGLFHVGADHVYPIFVRIFPGGDPGHLWGDVDAGDALDVPV